MKYKTLEELIEAYRSEELSGDCWLSIDNDTTFVYVNDEEVFSMDPNDLLAEALYLLGVPSEHV